MSITKIKATGNYGEDLAEKYLKKNKCKILDRNYSCKLGEIDIIACNKQYILFVEVKTRGENYIFTPSEAVTKSKQIKLLKTATHYLMNNKINLQPRFDVCEVYLFANKKPEINYIENAFMQEGDYATF